MHFFFQHGNLFQKYKIYILTFFFFLTVSSKQVWFYPPLWKHARRSWTCEVLYRLLMFWQFQPKSFLKSVSVLSAHFSDNHPLSPAAQCRRFRSPFALSCVLSFPFCYTGFKSFCKRNYLTNLTKFVKLYWYTLDLYESYYFHYMPLVSVQAGTWWLCEITIARSHKDEIILSGVCLLKVLSVLLLTQMLSHSSTKHS